jgi:uncharacterized membrane protein
MANLKKVVQATTPFVLGFIMLAANATVFLIPIFWGRVIALATLILLQYILEAKNDDLEWNSYSSFFSKELSAYSAFIQNLIWVFAKWVTMLNCIYVGIAFNSEVNNFGLYLPLIFGSLLVILSVSYWLELHKRSDNGFDMLKVFLALPVFLLTLVSICLNFGTQFIWMPIIVFFLIDGFYVFNDLTVIIKRRHRDKIMPTLERIFVLIGIVSTIYQFRFAKILFGLVLWKIIFGLLIIILLIVLIRLLVKYFIKRMKKRQQKKEREKKEREEKLKTEQIIQREVEKKAEITKRFYSISNRIDFGTELNHEEAYFLIKNYFFDGFSKDRFFDGFKNIKIKDAIILETSDIKRQIIYRDTASHFLYLLNEIYAATFNDELLKKLAKLLADFCNYINDHSDYKGADDLRKLVEKKCFSFPPYEWKEDKEI